MASDDDVITSEGLRKSYGAVNALKGVDLKVAAGGIVGLLGPNGAGKTSFVEILEGLRPPTAGRITVLGLDPTREPRALKERIGVQLQATALPAELTAAEVLRLYAGFYLRSAKVADVLERVGLTAKARARVRTLSGGQRQRLAVGMALIHDPDLLILDEPTAGLDPMARRGIHEILRDLRARGRTILLTSHYVDEIELLADRVIVLRSGEIVADGTPLDLMARASGASTLWVAVDGAFDPTPLFTAGVAPCGREGKHHRFTAQDPTAAVLALADLLRAQGLRLTDLRMKRPTLEDVYLELIADGTPAVSETEVA